MAKFYSNENFPLEIVRFLRNFDHDILTSLEAGRANQSIPDNEVLAYATAENRILITLNRDDFIKLHRSGIDHAGIIICKEDRDYFGQAQARQDYLQQQTSSLNNCLIRVQKQNQPNLAQQRFIVRCL
ncbi:MAG: DUF5615 family PIN-like protein [Microcystaceae cyanobacterium]